MMQGATGEQGRSAEAAPRAARGVLGTCLGVALAVAASPTSALASPLGTAAHEAGRVPVASREVGAGDWSLKRVAGDPEWDVPERQAWEAMIRRHRGPARDEDRQETRPRRRDRRVESHGATLDRLYQRRPSPSAIRPEVPWTTGGLRPSMAYQKDYEETEDPYAAGLGARIPSHMDPLDLEAKDSFGKGIIEIGEALKQALAEDGAGLKAAFDGGPYEVRDLVVKSRAPAFTPHPYGIGYRFMLLVRGLYQSREGWHQPVHFRVRLDALVGGDGLVRADILPDWDPSEGAAGGAPPDLDSHLLTAQRRIADAFGPLETQAIEARIRDVLRATLPLARRPPGRKLPNPFRDEVYVPIALKTATVTLDRDGDGKADAESLQIVNRVQRVAREGVRRGDPLRFDFQQYVGWEISLGQNKVLARSEGRIKLALYGDTDGDGLPDLILVEDRGERQVEHHPYAPAHKYLLRPAIYFLDGQDMGRDYFDLGPVRFDFPPGADGSEIRSARLVSREVGGDFRDLDVALEIFDPEGRVLRQDTVFDRYPANRRAPDQVGYQRAEFAGHDHPGRVRGVRLLCHFDTDRHDLDAAAEKALQAAWGQVGYGEVLSVSLVGHADDRASYEYNLALGMRRATSVRSWLATQGVRPEKVKLSSRGEYEPVASNTSSEGMSENRRVQGWLLVRPAPPDRPRWMGRLGVPHPPGG